jgi:D-glycero-alpha-D-manno-heptose-7-phosphate kinase
MKTTLREKPWLVTAPVRVDLAGGTLDIYPLETFFHPAMTVNVAVAPPVRAAFRPMRRPVLRVTARDQQMSVSYHSIAQIPASGGALPLIAALLRHHHPKGGFFIETRSSVPKGSGLGGSSALAVALFRLLEKVAHRRPISPERMVGLLQTLESRVIEAPTGVQDYYPAIFGGVQALWYEGGEVRREVLPARATGFLDKTLLLAYTGQSRLSARTNWNVFKAAFENRGGVRRRLAEIGEAALRVREAVLKEDINWLAEGVAREWKARQGLARGIATARMRRFERRAVKAGALACKACGAGGGGCMLFVCPPSRRKQVAEALEEAGAKLLPMKTAFSGVRVRRRG